MPFREIREVELGQILICSKDHHGLTIVEFPLPTRILKLSALLATWFVLSSLAQAAEPPKAPEGFTVLFNGEDFTGWHGMGHFDLRKLAEMSDAQRAEKRAADMNDLKEHWKVENGELVNDGKGVYMTTDKDYTDMEFL